MTPIQTVIEYPGRYYTEQDEVPGHYYTEAISPCGEAEFYRWM